MSVTVKQLLKLPSLANANVVAGRGGLDRIVSSVSVLEAASFKELGEYAYPNDEYTGSEIVITGFINNPDDIETQYNTIKALSNMGEVGLIIYYVGIYLKRIDESLIRLADELDFPLICMPVNQSGLRYSEAIADIMGVIVRDQISGESMFVSLIESMSKRPAHQQNISTMVRLISNHLRSSIVFTTDSNYTICEAAWPNELSGIHTEIEKLSEKDFVINPANFKSMDDALVYKLDIHVSGDNYHLYIVHVGGALPHVMLQQASEAVRIAVKLWGNESGGNAAAEIIDAILTDQPAKMKSLSEMLNVDIESADTMWVVEGDGFTIQHVNKISQEADKFCNTVITDIYKDDIIVFTDNLKRRVNIEALKNNIQMVIPEARTIGFFTNLENTSEVRSVYLEYDKYKSDASIIFPDKTFFGKGNLEFAKSCRNIINNGNESVNRYLELLEIIESRRGGDELIRTLETFLLDASCNIQVTSEKMFVHKNTIKYRMNLIDDILGFTIGDMPDSEEYYKACGIKRLLNN